mgnify:CR=1 FL=1
MINRNYKPVKLAVSLKNINNNIAKNINKTDFVIYSKWAEIVGNFFFEYSEPEKITFIPKAINEEESKNYYKILHVKVAPVAAVEFQHFQNKIIEKINSFFGYKAIDNIKIYQNFSPKVKYTSLKRNSKIDNNLLYSKKNEIKDTTHKISDKELGKSLLNLGLSIGKNEKS